MDGSFLSRTEVATASRDFVCIRLATYESQEEADFLKGIYTRGGNLENTTFAILSSDGKKQLVKSGRGPHHAFRSGRDMAEGMKKIAAGYPDRKAPLSDTAVPLMDTVDLGLNVASCDTLPVIITYAKTQSELDKINKSLIKLAWDKELAGQYVFASTTNVKKLKPVTGFDADHSIMIVSPGEFGVSGKVMAQFAADIDRVELRRKMVEIAAKYPHKTKSRKSHNDAGITLGLEWETAIPVTDPGSLKAKERIRGGR